MASLKLLVHKEKNKVLYAESDKDFVDYLFSFLTMPLGAIVQRIGSNIGSLNTLHKSVGDLETQLLQTDACKQMLLSPKSASEEQSKNLKVNIDPSSPEDYYVCSSCIGSPAKIKLASAGHRVRCSCGNILNKSVTYEKSSDGKDGVFVMEDMKFMITDDLQVSPVSTLTSFELLKTLGISDASVLEVRIERLDNFTHCFGVGHTRARRLLKHLLFSKSPLTDTFLREKDTEQGLHIDVENTACLDRDTDENSKKINIKLLLSKSNKKVLYAEAGEEFPDLLFSFLTFPLGAVVKLLGECGMGCVDNLYKSVKDLSLKDCMKSEECKAKLLSPKIASYFGSKNQLLKIEEQVPLQPKLFYCSSCYNNCYVTFSGIRSCSHGSKAMQLRTINPKHSDIVHDLGGAFVAGPAMFTVTDELIVKPLSPISGISLINKFSFPISDLEEVVVSVGEIEALSLLRTSLISNTVFSDVFCSKKPQQSRKRSSEGSVPPDKRPKTETECL